MPTRRQVVERLLNNDSYDPNILPDFDKDFPTTVTVQVTIGNMHSLSESSMEYSLDVYLRSWWKDDRLDFSTISNLSKLELDINNMDKVWQPDLFFENEKRAEIHKVTKINKLMHIFRDGTVVSSLRISLALSCPMSLHYYPFDSQTCSLTIQSYGYTSEYINLNWHPNQGVRTEDYELPQFELLEDKITTEKYDDQYVTGIFSTLKANLHLKRKVGFYVLQVFIPSIFFVVLSWVSFFVDAEAVPARVSLGVTCVLTMTTQSAGTRQTLPPVSYGKAIDVWMFVCLLFVFGALLEFAYVNVLVRHRRRTEEKRKANEKAEGKERHDLKMEETPKKDGTTGKRGFFKKLFSLPEDKEGKPHRVDYVSRFAFPVCFGFFLFVFFTVCGIQT